MNIPVTIDRWGKDHWSTLAYAFTCWANSAPLDPERMRCDPTLHPLHANRANGDCSGPPYPTRLKGGDTLTPHDDWSCMDDAEAEGLVELHGTGLHRRYRFTLRGEAVMRALLDHKATGGGFATFVPPVGPLHTLPGVVEPEAPALYTSK